MKGREAAGVSWPLPWWVTIVPGLVVGGLTFGITLTASSWPYVAPARLSGMIGQAQELTGPVACVCAAWVAERFVNRRSPLAPTTATRADGRQGMRVLVNIAASWVGLLALGGLAAVALVLRDATGGHYYISQAIVDVLQAAFFVVSGFAMGVVIARWHAPLWALIWSLAWVWIVPVYSGGLFPYPSRNVEYLLFPGQPASDHQKLNEVSLFLIISWWLVVLVVWAACLIIWFRGVGRLLPRRVVPVCAVALVAAAASGVFLSHVAPSPFDPAQPSAAVCGTKAQLEYCVTPEQRVLLPKFIAATYPSVARMGFAWPKSVHRLVSFSVAGEGTRPPKGDLGVSVTSTSGIPSAQMDVGAGLAGLDACGSGRNNPAATSWAFDFAQWLARSPDGRSDSSAQARSLWDSSDGVVRRWYVANSAALLKCQYTGPGPRVN